MRDRPPLRQRRHAGEARDGEAVAAVGWAVGELDDAAARTLRERSVILDRIG